MDTSTLIALIALFFTFLSVIVIPLIIYAFRQNARLIALESSQVKIADLEKIYTKLNDMDDKISERYVTRNECVKSCS